MTRHKVKTPSSYKPRIPRIAKLRKAHPTVHLLSSTGEYAACGRLPSDNSQLKCTDNLAEVTCFLCKPRPHNHTAFLTESRNET